MPKSAEIESRYDIRIHSAVEIDGLWKIESERGTLELRLYDSDQTAACHRWTTLLTFLAENSYPAPRLIQTVDGNPTSLWEDRSGVLSTTVSGDSPDYEPDFFYGLGVTVGRLHALDIAQMKLPRAGYDVRSERKRFIEQDGNPAIRSWEGYGSVRDELIQAWDRMPDFEDHPQVLTNTSVFEWCALLTPEGVALENWQQAGIGPAIIDIGPLFAFQGLMPDPEAPLRPSVAWAFLAGYRTTRHLTPLEIDQLPDAIALGVLTYAVERWREPIEEVTWWRARHILDCRAQIASQLTRFLEVSSPWNRQLRTPTYVASPPEATHPSLRPSPNEFEAEYGIAVDRIVRLSGRAWHVLSGDREWVLRLHDPELQVYHPGEIATLQFLESVDFFAPRLLPTRRGEVLVHRGDKVGYAVTYLKGEPVDRSFGPVRETGRLIAQIHSLNAEHAEIQDNQHS